MTAYIKIIPHKDQRYNTVGDWFFDDQDTLHIRVSDLGSDYMNSLVAHHEYTEAILCRQANITEKQVDNFDMNWHGKDGTEPGDDIKAPYYQQHQIASGFERIMAQEIGVSWEQYGETVERVMKTWVEKEKAQ